MVDERVRELIRQRADASAIRRAADQAGLTALRDDGAAKVLAGTTTAEEVLRVTRQDA